MNITIENTMKTWISAFMGGLAGSLLNIVNDYK